MKDIWNNERKAFWCMCFQRAKFNRLKRRVHQAQHLLVDKKITWGTYINIQTQAFREIIGPIAKI